MRPCVSLPNHVCMRAFDLPAPQDWLHLLGHLFEQCFSSRCV